MEATRGATVQTRSVAVDLDAMWKSAIARPTVSALRRRNMVNQASVRIFKCILATNFTMHRWFMR
jgi:hypothetical protein